MIVRKLRILLYTIVGFMIGVMAIFLFMVVEHTIWAIAVEVGILPETSEPSEFISPIIFLIIIFIFIKRKVL